MVLKGVMTIELTDETTGAVETVMEENMITEAVNNILGLNPMGIFYAATGQYGSSGSLEWEPAANLPQHDRRHSAVFQSADGGCRKYL